MKRAYEVVLETYHRPSGTVVELRTYVQRDSDEPYDEESVIAEGIDIAEDILGKSNDAHFKVDAVHEVVI
jgi:hypothetical protein